jgi:hypothetical protein
MTAAQLLGTLGPADAPPKMDALPVSSRYYGIEIATLVTADQREIVYLRRRFLPDPDRLALIGEHVVTQAERPDHVAAEELGDPELFWRLCDGNPVLRAEELTEQVGRRLRITLPEAMPGMPNG